MKVSNVACVRNGHLLFDNVSFELNAGELLIVEGPNGSGKSSLLRLLSGISTPASGEIHLSHDLHYIGHESGIKSHLTVTENLQLIQHICLSSSSSLDETLKALQLTPVKNSFAKNLSAGQKRRVALAKLFLIRRKIWLLDEPLTALDATTQAYFLSQLESHLHEGGVAVISTHQAFSLSKGVIKSLRLTPC